MQLSGIIALLTLASTSAYQPMSMMAKSGKTGGKAIAAKDYSSQYLRTAEPGSGPAGAWFVRERDGMSKALPWQTAPVIAEGGLVGDYGFDPWNLASTFDIAWLRAAELKHGRVCMLGIVGLVAPELVQNPVGFEGWQFPEEFTKMNGIDAIQSAPQFGIAQIVIACGLAEIASFGSLYKSDFAYDDTLSPKERKFIKQGNINALAGAAKTAAKVGYFSDKSEYLSPVSGKVPGDLGFDPCGFADNGVLPEYAEAEIKHARLAMIALTGALFQTFLNPGQGLLESTLKWAQNIN